MIIKNKVAKRTVRGRTRRTITLSEVQGLAIRLNATAVALHARLERIRMAVAAETAQLHLYEVEMRECEQRIEDIDYYIEETENDLQVCVCDHLQAEYEMELDDLWNEREYEFNLMKRMSVVHGMHKERHHKLTIVYATARAQLLRIKRKQQILLVLAIRLGIVKLYAAHPKQLQ